MKAVHLLPALVISLSVAGCAAAAPSAAPGNAAQQAPAATARAESTPSPSAGAAGLTRSDEQGAVTVKVTPLNLSSAGATVDFEVDMNTHSVDLGMNLASLATLTTDTGLRVAPVKWEAPGGGHHVSGRLVFPSSVDGRPLLKGATKVTLLLRDVAAPERTFVWSIQ